MPASGTALDKNIKQEVEAFKMKQKDAKVPWIIFEIKQNEANVEVVTIAKKGDATDNLATLHEELKRRHAAYFILDYDPPEELRAKKGIAKNQNFPMTCFWCGDCAKISEKMKYSSTVATLKSATSSLKVYLKLTILMTSPMNRS